MPADSYVLLFLWHPRRDEEAEGRMKALVDRFKSADKDGWVREGAPAVCLLGWVPAAAPGQC